MPTTATLEQFCDRLRRRNSETSPLIVAISGFAGAGKSTLAKGLAYELDRAVLVHADDFSIDQQKKRCDDWSSIDRQRLIEEVLVPAREAGQFRYQRYDWPKNRLAEWHEHSDFAYLLLEGIGLIHPDLMTWLEVTAWVDVPIEVANERGKRRDREIHRVNHDNLWDELWSFNDRDYFKRFHPAEAVDFLIEPDSFP